MSLRLRRFCCRSGAQWDKQHGVDVERERLLAHTREAVTKGLASGNMWHAATNAEHARPMLQVCCVLSLASRSAPRVDILLWELRDHDVAGERECLLAHAQRLSQDSWPRAGFGMQPLK